MLEMKTLPIWRHSMQSATMCSRGNTTERGRKLGNTGCFLETCQGAGSRCGCWLRRE
jgi:hypothetical protein